MKQFFPSDISVTGLFFLIRFNFAVLILLLSGCGSYDYYRNAASGHFEILRKAEPVEDVIARETTSPKLKKALVQLQQARDFAVKELYLPDNGSYRHYADIDRTCVTWNVIATEEFSVEPEEWCFPVAGCVSYKGFFARQDAKNFSAKLQAQGMDTFVAGALAYSTLGWFDDPILNTMLDHGETSCIEVLFHELAHQKLYIQDDTAFNEAFATAVAEEGMRRWFATTGNHEAYEKFLAFRRQQNQCNALILDTREKLDSLYHRKIGLEQKRKEKQKIFRRLKADYENLQEEWHGDDRYDAWMALDLNNAHLSLVATYNNLVPIFHQILVQSRDDMEIFYARVSTIASQPFGERHLTLQEIHARNFDAARLTVLP